MNSNVFLHHCVRTVKRDYIFGLHSSSFEEKKEKEKGKKMLPYVKTFTSGLHRRKYAVDSCVPGVVDGRMQERLSFLSVHWYLPVNV